MIDLSSLRTKIAYLFGNRPEQGDSEPEAEPDTKPMSLHREARYQIGQVVRHRLFQFRGVIFDVDAEYANTEEWYESIPEKMRPHRDQPYYHLFAENEKSHYVAYVSEQNLIPDETREPVNHPDIPDVFELTDSGNYQLRSGYAN